MTPSCCKCCYGTALLRGGFFCWLFVGADDFHATDDPDTFTALANRFDLIINTVSAPIDADAYLRLLDLDGSMVNVGAPPEPVQVRLGTLLGGRRSF